MTLSRVVNFGELELLRGVGGSQSPQNILDVVTFCLASKGYLPNKIFRRYPDERGGVLHVCNHSTVANSGWLSEYFGFLKLL